MKRWRALIALLNLVVLGYLLQWSPNGNTLVALSKHAAFVELPSSPIDAGLQSPDSKTLQTALELSRMNIRAIPQTYDGIGQHLRVYRTLFRRVINYPGSSGLNKVEAALAKMETNLFPWLFKRFKSSKELYHSFGGRGIVMTCGMKDLTYALHTLRVIRNHLNCTLPVQLFYNGDSDLTLEARGLLSKENATLVDLTQWVDTSNFGIKGWSIKPFAMLFSTFEEVIFIDADAVFFQNPERVFEMKGYIEAGSFYFRDRTLMQVSNATYQTTVLKHFQKYVKYPSQYLQDTNRVLKSLSQHEVDSGVFVWDKKRVFEVAMGSALLNTPPFLDSKILHGDKETYWMIHEMIGIPYRWELTGGGSMGRLVQEKDGSWVCGGLYHPDESQRPFWFNGGMLVNKYDTSAFGQSTIQITHWGLDVTFDHVQWKNIVCFKPKLDQNELGSLDQAQLQLAHEIAREWNSVIAQVPLPPYRHSYK